MKVELFSVYDTAAERFLPTWDAPTMEFAIRAFRETVNRPDHQFNKYPGDYTLFHVGSFNQETGQLEPLSTPHSRRS